LGVGRVYVVVFVGFGGAWGGVVGRVIGEVARVVRGYVGRGRRGRG
jgi:hypothetical protein